MGKNPNTPLIPNNMLQKAAGVDEVLGKDLHKIYCSGVSKLLYLTKHSRPDILSEVRELMEHVNKPGVTPKTLLRVLNYVKQTK